MEPPEKGLACNCSICSRAGWLLTFVGKDAVRIQTEADALQDYQFGKKSLHHTFCRTCGIHAFSSGISPDGSATFAINLRCLTDLDPSGLAVESYDGKSV
jgi:hypothetical protein